MLWKHRFLIVKWKIVKDCKLFKNKAKIKNILIEKLIN
jgi:hypothetical protein